MIYLFWSIITPILFAAISMLLPIKYAKYIALIVQPFMVLTSYINFMHVKTNGTIMQNIGGWPDFIGITLRADLISSVLVLITTILFLFLMLFIIDRKYVNNLFLFLFLVMEGLIVGIFLSNDLFNIFIFVEISTVVISILIMFKKDSEAIYDGLLYLLINIVAMSFFLFGVGMLYKTFGVIDFNGLKIGIEKLESNKPIILPYAFLITAVSLKAALMPLFSWLPKAHGTPSAPSVVSAILSGLYIKTGVFLFLRIQDIFLPKIDTSNLFLVLGFITAIIGFILSVVQKDIKLILAYSTVSQIGLIMMGINMNNPETYIGSIFHMLNHTIFKSTLFLASGLIIDEYKTRNIYEIKGVFKRLPLVSLACIFSILGIIGAPFFNGSISKYWISYGASNTWAEYALLLVNLGTIIIFTKYSEIFWSRGKYKKNSSVKFSFQNTIILIMGLMSFLGGIFGSNLIDFLFDAQLIIDPISYLVKTLIFIITLVIGMGTYYSWLKELNFLDVFKKFQLSFNGVCLSLALFFSFILLYLQFTL